MRIIGGELGGRRLPARVVGATRPTTDRVREAVASLLHSRRAIEGALVLDLFAGTGAMGLEMLSRGARHLVSVDRDVRAVDRNAAALGLRAQVASLRLDLWKQQQEVVSRITAAAADPFSVAIVDPPYADTTRLPPLLETLASACSASAHMVLEYRAADAVPAVAGWSLDRSYRYGDTGIALLTPIA